MHIQFDNVSLGPTGLTFSNNPNNIHIYQPSQLRTFILFFLNIGLFQFSTRYDMTP